VTQPAPQGRFGVRVLGVGLSALGVFLTAFAVLAWFWREPALGFVIPGLVAAGLGTGLLRVSGRYAEPSHREALGAVLALWLVFPLVGGVPYLWMGGLGPLDALFESMSGFTTTGATVLTDFDAFSRSLFAWRAFTQWVGGVGIIVLFLAVFPRLAIAGRELFATEAPGPTEERFTPHLRSTALAVLSVYVTLTVAAALAYVLAGLTPFDAVLHAFTTLAAGGFSPEARSFEGFGAAAQWVAVVFMLLAGTSFALQFRAAVSRRPGVLLRDVEFRVYLTIVVVATGVLSLVLVPIFGEAGVRHAAFQVASILTTTGYASVDFAAWPSQAQTVLLALMFIGGSAGSAAGGVKVIRWWIVAKHTAREVQRTLHPRSVLPVRVGRRVVPEGVLRAVAAFLTVYVGTFVFIAATLGLLGHDFETSFSAAIATLGNIGPGIAAVGPMASFSAFEPLAKVVLTFAMYAGRLEVVTVFLLFSGDWWRRSRPWRSRSLVRPGEVD